MSTGGRIASFFMLWPTSYACRAPSGQPHGGPFDPKSAGFPLPSAAFLWHPSLGLLAMTLLPTTHSTVSRFGVAMIFTVTVVAIRGALQPVFGNFLPLQMLIFAV